MKNAGSKTWGLSSSYRFCAPAILAAIISLGLASGQDAHAAQHLVGPNGFPEICYVIKYAQSGDEIVVEPGEYAPFSFGDLDDITVRGANQAARPIINAKKDLGFVDDYCLLAGGSAIEITGGQTNATILDNLEVLGGNASGSGGGILVENSAPVIKNTLVWQNEASQNGGGIAFIGSKGQTDRPRLFNVNVTQNTADEGGGGIAAIDASPIIESSFIQSNEAVFIQNDVVGNWSKGGGVLAESVEDGATLMQLELLDTVVSHNKGDDGGGVYMYGEAGKGLSATITASHIDNNWSNNRGGGLHNYNANASLDYVTFIDNHAEIDGGGIYHVESSPNFTNVTIADNFAQFDGGGVYVKGEAALPTFRDALIVHNTAGWGAAMYVNNAAVQVSSSTLADNSADVVDGVYLVDAQTPSVFKNTIIWGNLQSSPNPLSNQIEYSSTALPLLAFSDIEGVNGSGASLSCTNCIDKPPAFAPGPVTLLQPEGSYYLQPVSPCVDAGATNTTPPLAGSGFGTTQVSLVPDAQPVDIGFHYDGPQQPPLTAILTSPSFVNGSFWDASGDLPLTLTASPCPSTSTCMYLMVGAVEHATNPATAPGFVSAEGVLVPINMANGYAQLLLSDPNATFQNGLGQLAPDGTATVTLLSAPFQKYIGNPSVSNAKLYHAFVVIEVPNQGYPFVRESSSVFTLTLP